jgi:ATP-binding cassette subfamily F protein 2
MESIDALAKAVNEFEGGMVLVSHDMRLISQVAKEIWICDHKTVTRYKGDILNFKMDMRAQMGIDDKKQQLRGDASVAQKEKDVPKPKPVVVKKMIEVVPPPKKTTTVDVVSPLKKMEEDDDAATAVTSTTSTTASSFDTDPMRRSLADAANAPARKAYVPPHLRKKMSS